MEARSCVELSRSRSALHRGEGDSPVGAEMQKKRRGRSLGFVTSL